MISERSEVEGSVCCWPCFTLVLCDFGLGWSLSLRSLSGKRTMGQSKSIFSQEELEEYQVESLLSFAEVGLATTHARTMFWLAVDRISPISPRPRLSSKILVLPRESLIYFPIADLHGIVCVLDGLQCLRTISSPWSRPRKTKPTRIHPAGNCISSLSRNQSEFVFWIMAS